MSPIWPKLAKKIDLWPLRLYLENKHQMYWFDICSFLLSIPVFVFSEVVFSSSLSLPLTIIELGIKIQSTGIMQNAYHTLNE